MDLGNRMKEYEQAYNIKLPKRLPVIIRLDGKAFHTFTRKMEKPFDSELINAMDLTAQVLVDNIQGALLAYVQSDEISILINNYQSLEFDPYFDNKVQKLASITASIATSWFNMFIQQPTNALFDSRVFVLPKEEVVNYFIWRQKDWERNSIQMLTRSLYSHKQVEGKNTSQMNEMCFQKGKNWDKLPTHLKRGRVVKKNLETGKNVIDREIPQFTKDREFIQQYVDYEKEVQTT